MKNFQDSSSPPNYLFDGQIFYKYPNLLKDWIVPPAFDFPAHLMQFVIQIL